jgi:ribonuclease HI
MNLTIHFDGSCWPNPGGLAKYGFTVRSTDGKINHRGYGVIGNNERMSNNHAELYAMAEGLEWAIALMRLQKLSAIIVIGDSQVAVRLMDGGYRARNWKLYYPQYVRAKIAQEYLESYTCTVKFEWCPREMNQECDDLSKMPEINVSQELLSEAEYLLDNHLPEE